MASVLRASLAMRSLFARPTTFCSIKTNIVFNITTTVPEAEIDSHTNPDSRSNKRIARIFSQFEDKCQRNEMVVKKDFVKTLDLFESAIEKGDAHETPDISLYSAMLLRCCGKLMFDTPLENREVLAGKLWSLMKDNKVPLDTSHYNSLIRALNENMSKFDPKSILDEMKAANLHPDMITYQRCIHQYSLQGNIEGAIELLETMKNAGFELTETLFASLITGYGKQENPQPVFEMFDLMRSNNIEPGSRSYAAAFISLGERLEKDPKAAEELKKLYESYEKDEIQFTLNDALDLIAHLSRFRDSNELLDKLLSETANTQLNSIGARYRILSAMIRANRFEEASKLFWSQRVSERALQTGNIGAYWIRAMVSHTNVPAEAALKECEKMREKGFNAKPFHLLYHMSAELGRLDLVRETLKRIVEEEPMKIQFAWPLIAQAKDEGEIVSTLKNVINPMMDQNDLMETFSLWVWPKFSTNAQRLFELNKKELNYDDNMLIASFLNYSVQENKIMEAVKFISEAPQDLLGDTARSTSGAGGDDDEGPDGEPMITPRLTRPNRSDRSNLVSRLLQQIAEQTKDPELVKKAFSMCQLPKQQATNRSLSSLVKVHLLNGDFQGALAEFFRICNEYRATPCRSELMQHCLENKNPEELQKIMNVVTELFGEQNALFDLAVCCLKCNKLKQAQKIFASPGFRVNPVRVYAVARSFARMNDVTALEHFVHLARDMYDVNQEILYQILLDSYERTSNPKRALHLWNMMQEEEFQPSKRSLIMIADILEKHNIQVPFQKPRVISGRT